MTRWSSRGCECPVLPERLDTYILFRGGGCSKDRDGNLMLKKDMDEQDVTVRSLANSMEARIPVGMIIGKSIEASIG
jgi:hypothetical protein